MAYLVQFSYFKTPYLEKSNIMSRNFTIPHKEQSDDVVRYLIVKTYTDGNKPIFAAAHFKEYIDFYLKKYSSPLKTEAKVRFTEDTSAINAKMRSCSTDGFYLVNLHIDIDSLLDKEIAKNYVLVDCRKFSGSGFREYKKKEF